MDDSGSEAKGFAERMMLGVCGWVRTAIRLRANGEIVFVFADDETWGERSEKAEETRPDQGRNSAFRLETR